MKVLVFGAFGMLGHKLIERWAERFEVVATVRGPANGRTPPNGVRIVGNVDAEDPGIADSLVSSERPDVVFNAAGIIKQLPSSKNTIRALSVNSIFPHRLAEAGGKYGARVITVSTDCVFAGDRGMYTEEDEPDARDLYGVSKHLGELSGPNCLTLRTSIIGPEIGTHHSLVEWFLSNQGGTVKGFRRAIYSGFPTVVLADIIAGIIEKSPALTGLYHLSSDPIDKHALLCLIRDAYSADIDIEPDDDFAIDRSLDSSRFRGETGFVPAPWPELISIMAGNDTRQRWK